ncbi:MAG: hypothetical protein H7A51_13455 [Akkermansiaceae bacterium]|nr:hypothetical protein [Akkermansiaceae bacterium]
MMKKCNYRCVVILTVTALTAMVLIGISGIWRRCLSDDKIWASIIEGDAYAVYLDAATEEFGSPDMAEGTYKQWAIQRWQSHNGIFTTQQDFLTHGVIFELELIDGDWILVATKYKEGAPLPQ